MKKQAQTAGRSKGFLALAGEALHVLGEEIVEGKDKVVETATGKFTRLKTAVSRLTHKKGATAKRGVKKAAGKQLPKNIGKKTAKKKTAKKKAISKATKAKQGGGR
ncbi:MAG TPA: hypothetical protein VN616_09510 [Puia sp.]|nr:hypothetical protein [Puia sp.]